MGSIVDVVSLNLVEINIIKSKYPQCVLTRQSNSEHHIQQYELVIPDEDEQDDSYYNFLLDNLIAMCSRKFHTRLAKDKQFRVRIRARADANLRKWRQPGETAKGKMSDTVGENVIAAKERGIAAKARCRHHQ